MLVAVSELSCASLVLIGTLRLQIQLLNQRNARPTKKEESSIDTLRQVDCVKILSCLSGQHCNY